MEDRTGTARFWKPVSRNYRTERSDKRHDLSGADPKIAEIAPGVRGV